MKKIKVQDILHIIYIIVMFLLFAAACILIDNDKLLAAIAHLSGIPFMLCFYPLLFPAKDDKEDAV